MVQERGVGNHMTYPSVLGAARRLVLVPCKVPGRMLRDEAEAGSDHGGFHQLSTFLLTSFSSDSNLLPTLSRPRYQSPSQFYWP